MAKRPWAFVLTFFLVIGTAGMALGNPPNNGPGWRLRKASVGGYLSKEYQRRASSHGYHQWNVLVLKRLDLAQATFRLHQ